MTFENGLRKGGSTHLEIWRFCILLLEKARFTTLAGSEFLNSHYLKCMIDLKLFFAFFVILFDLPGKSALANSFILSVCL